jgi:glycosyltransferase involved in cell wall biosynthesis
VEAERYPATVDREAVRATLGFAASDHVMTMVGTFKRQKGHEVLVRAFEGVVRRHRDLHLLLVGDGELAGAVRRQVEAARLSDRVHFLGTRRDVGALLAASDSFVLPSLWEGLPIALIEAMASRLPVVATDVSGTRQVMLDGVTGWLVPPGDADRLEAAINALLADTDEAARRASAARERIESAFHARRQAQQLIDLFGGAA